MAKMLLGKEVADEIIARCKERIADCALNNACPTLAIISIGKDDSNAAYIRGIKSKAQAAGVALRFFELAEDVSQQEVNTLVCKLNADNDIHGILPMLPFPADSGVNQREVCELISPEKDVDCAGYQASSNAYFDRSGFAPCTAEACVKILDHYGIEISGKNVVVVGRSFVVGKPVANLLLNRNATVTVCHSKTQNLPKIVANSDIVVVAVGQPRMLPENFFRFGQTVIDAGINWDEKLHKLCGDVDTDSAEGVVSAITPVPGGVGAVTSAVLVEHVVESFCKK